MNTVKENLAKRVIFLCLVFISQNLFSRESNAPLLACNWAGINGSWSNTANWSCGIIPGTGDDVAINGGTSSFDPMAVVVVQNLTINGGTLNLNGGTIRITGIASLNTGAVINGTVDFLNAASVTFGNGFTCSATVLGTGDRFFFNGATFNASVSLTKSFGSPSSDISAGGNTFNGPFQLYNKAIGTAITLANNNPDVYNGNSTFEIDVSNASGLNGSTINISDRAAGNTFNGDILVKSHDLINNVAVNSTCNCGIYFGRNGGTTTLQPGFLISDGNNEFDRGTLQIGNFTQLGNTPQALNFYWPGSAGPPNTNSSSSLVLQIGPGSTFNGNVDFQASNLLLWGSVYNGTVSNFEKLTGGSSATYCEGGNTFNSPTTTFVNNTRSTFRLANTWADAFNGSTVNFVCRFGDTKIEVAHNGVNVFKGNINLTKEGSGTCTEPVKFATGFTGRALFDSGTPQVITRNIDMAIPQFGRMTVDKPAEDITLNDAGPGSPISILYYLDFQKGRIFSSVNSYVLFEDNALAYTPSDLSFVHGAVKKRGDDIFAFPVGKGSYFRPMAMRDAPAPGSLYMVEYFSQAPPFVNSAKQSTLGQINPYEHWIFSRETGASNVAVELTWGNYPNPAITSLTELQIARWSTVNSIWEDYGNGGTAGSITPFSGMILSSGPVSTFSATLNLDDVITFAGAPAVAAPTVSVSSYEYCEGENAAALSATPSTGGTLYWYTTSTGGTGSSTAPTPSTAAPGTTTYYVSQEVGGVESSRVPVTVTVYPLPSAPAATDVTYQQGSAANPLTATGSPGGVLQWYTTDTGGSASGTAPTPSTVTVGETLYYVSQIVNGCEGPRAAIRVTITAAPAVPVPVVSSSPVEYCQGDVAGVLTASPAQGGSLLWYTFSSGGTGLSTPPTPSTATSGTLTFYVSQTINGEESGRVPVTVIVNPTPPLPVVANITYEQFAAASPLTAGVYPGATVLWYNNPVGGAGSATSPTPVTASLGVYTYYVSQTVNGCEGPRAEITVTIAPPQALQVNFSVSGKCLSHEFNAHAYPEDTNYEFRWFCDGCINSFESGNASTSFIFENPGEHTVRLEVYYSGTLRGQAQKQFVVEPCPDNIFTPNGDGINDDWVKNNFDNAITKVVIFNRWGEVVFTSTGSRHRWDGIYHGKLLESGTYYYIEEKGNNIGKGYITLLKN